MIYCCLCSLCRSPLTPVPHAMKCKRLAIVWQVAQGQDWQNNMRYRSGHLTVEDLISIVQRLPPGTSPIPAVAQGLHSLDSRACAAFLKDLSKVGLPHHAITIFDWLQSLPPENSLVRLCDVFTYTTGEERRQQKHSKYCSCHAPITVGFPTVQEQSHSTLRHSFLYKDVAVCPCYYNSGQLSNIPGVKDGTCMSSRSQVLPISVCSDLPVLPAELSPVTFAFLDTPTVATSPYYLLQASPFPRGVNPPPNQTLGSPHARCAADCLTLVAIANHLQTFTLQPGLQTHKALC